MSVTSDFWKELDRLNQSSGSKPSTTKKSGTTTVKGGSSGGTYRQGTSHTRSDNVSSSFWKKMKKDESFLDTYLKLSAGQSTDDDIAPISSKFSPSTITKKDDRKWYQKGLFEDGYDWGDVTKTILGVTDETASIKDLTWGSVKRGYYNSIYGEETFKEMDGLANEKEAYKELLESDEYQFTPGNDLASGISGGLEQFGQLFRQVTNPTTVAAVIGAAGGAALLGQAGPQVAIPEEFITVPGAAIAAFKAGSAASNLKIEAGHAYNEMIEMGVKEDIAKKIALAVGTGNAGLELLQVDELVDGLKVANKSGVTDSVAKQILAKLIDRGVDVFAKEVPQEVAQELITVGGVQAANYLDRGEFAYSADEVMGRLWDTTKQSALSFGMMNLPGAAMDVHSTIKYNKSLPSNQFVQNEEHPVVEQTPKVEQVTKPKVEEVQPVAEYEAKTTTPALTNFDSSGRQLTDSDKKAFGDSKLVDNEGNLLVMYHGSSADFDVVDFSKVGLNDDGWMALGDGFYLTPDKSMADEHAKGSKAGDKSQTLEFYANLKKPLISNAPLDFDCSDLVTKYGMDVEFVDTIRTGRDLIFGLQSHNIPVSSYLQSKGFDGALYLDESGKLVSAVVYDNKQLKRIRNTAQIAPEAEMVDDSPVATTEEFSAPGVVASEMETTTITELQRLYDERKTLNDTLMARYREGLYNEETENLAKQWQILNNRIADIEASQKQTETFAESPADAEATVSETESVAPDPVLKSDARAKFNPKTKRRTAAQSVFKHRALDVESLPSAAKEKVKGKYKAIERATDVATNLLMYGNDTLRPVHEIFDDVSKVGSVEDFNSYIYHKLNPERIAQDKDVHRGVTAEESQTYVKHLEAENPEFPKFAQEIYDWCDYLLKLQVEGGQISQETADKFKAMYPSYAPIRRDGFTDDLHIEELLGLVLGNQGNVLETDLASETVDAVKKTDPLSEEKKTTGGKKPILPLADTLAERVVQVHWAVAYNSDMFDDVTSSKPKHALYVDDALQYVDSFENPFTEKDFSYDKRNDNPMRNLFSQEELRRLRAETNGLIRAFLSGEFTSAHRAKLNENFVLHDLQVVRNKMKSLNNWLDKINGELASQKNDLSRLQQKKRDLTASSARSQAVGANSVDKLLADYDEKIDNLKKQIKETEKKLQNATRYVKEQTSLFNPFEYSDEARAKKGWGESFGFKELEDAYVGMLAFEKPTRQGSTYSSGTTFIDSDMQDTSDQIAPDPFAVDETYEEETMETPSVRYDEPRFTNPKDAKFDFDGKDKKLSRTSMFMEHGVDRGAVFEKWAKKTKNRKLEAKWDFIRKTYSATQHMLGRGVDGIKSLNSIFTEVDKLGVSEEFQDYLRLMAHWDGSTVKMRYGFPKNRAFLNTDMEAYKAREQAKNLEKSYPQFAKLAEDVYQNMAHLRGEMVEAGLMTQKDADFIAEVYPHFVPVRYDQEGNAISVFDSIATQMMNVKRACATNKFSGELLGTLNSAVPQEGIDSYDILGRFAGSPKLFEVGEFGNYPTYTFYDNGRKVNYAVSIQMEEAFKKTHPALNSHVPVLATANDVFRALTTEYNIPFHFANMIRDAKGVLLNSQHAAKTYMNIPRAYAEILANAKMYREYLEHGGGGNTYFDTKKREFTSSKASFRDIPPLAQISKFGNVIETAPRLAEYIASREEGRSIEVSMLDASRVTTNFGAGGDVTKFIDRNGCTFLNASVQGFAQTVRNFQEAKMRGLMGYGVLAAKMMLLGLPGFILDRIIWDDDEDYQNLPDYIKESYNIVGKTNSGRFIRIPKDRTQACIDNAFDQIADALTGDDEIDLLEWGRIFVANLAPNNPLDDNLFAPIRQVMTNKAWYGGDLVPSRLQDLPESEQFDDKTDAISRYLGETFDFSPYKINYLLNNYGGGLADVALPFLTPRAESGSDSVLDKVLNPFRDKFSTDYVLNNRVTDDFYEKVDELQTVANSAEATEEDKLIASYMLSRSSAISELWEQRREIQSSDLPDSSKFERMREIKDEINRKMSDALDSYEDVKITGRYATVADHRFNKDDSGRWWELKPKKADGTDNGYYTSERDHLKVLGITPEEYWNNQEYYHQQYNMAIYKPGEYALTKVFGGYDDYMSITKDWSSLVTGKNERGEWNTTVNKKTVGDIIYNLDIPEIEKHILYKSIYNYTDSHNREILEYIDSRDDISWAEMKKIVIELGFTVDENDMIGW